MGNFAAHSIEERRIGEQTRLDCLKTAAERNKWGQFATPAPLAVSLTRHARALMGEEPIRFLDPAVGTGSFFSALRKEFAARQIESATGIELDPLFADTARNLWEEQGLEVTQGDFTQQRPPRKRFNFILTNPPYVRHHHMTGEEKLRLKSQLARSLNLPISGLAGLYCYFLLHAHDWMEEGGLAVWLIPSEFMDVNYGETLRRYFTENVTLLQIHRFCPSDVQFADALVSSAVVIFRKSPPPVGHVVRFSFAGPIEQPQSQAGVPLDVLKSSRKWTQFPVSTTAATNTGPTLGELFTIKRGLATGANSFFFLTPAQVKEWEIPSAYLKPVLPGPRHIEGDIIDPLPDGTPNVSRRLYLLDCSEPEECIKARWPRFYEYIERGKTKKIDEAYLASHRSPWYSQEQRPPAPFLCTYMGRSRDGKHPFRFLWNRSQATAHNVYLMLYPKAVLREVLTQHPQLESLVFEALQRITPAQIKSEGRVYGGGLHKVEPKELAQIPACEVLDVIQTFARVEQQIELFL